MSRAQKAATIWTTFLSVVFAGLLFPELLKDRGFLPAFLFTGLGVLVIWVMYFGIGSFISWAVEGDVKEGKHDRMGPSGRQEGPGKSF